MYKVRKACTTHKSVIHKIILVTPNGKTRLNTKRINMFLLNRLLDQEKKRKKLHPSKSTIVVFSDDEDLDLQD